jgi:catalase
VFFFHDPRTGLRSAGNNWDFWTLLPEALHQVTIVMSDRGIPKSFRHMHLFGSHTFSMINATNERVWVKFHFRTQQGIANLTDAEAAAKVANDRESHRRDLLNAIEADDFPRWTLFTQVVTEAQATRHKYNPFDLTKVLPKKDYPLIEVGVTELSRYPHNYFAEVEQAAFWPATVVPGIGFSPNKMLQARLFSYVDTQRYRLGVNFNHITVNAPKCPVSSYHRDGAMRTNSNLGGALSYHPNSVGQWANQPDYSEPPMAVNGDAAHWDHRVDDDHWEQPGDLFRLMTPTQRQALFENTARAMGDARVLHAGRPGIWRRCGAGAGNERAGAGAVAGGAVGPGKLTPRSGAPPGSARGIATQTMRPPPSSLSPKLHLAE